MSKCKNGHTSFATRRLARFDASRVLGAPFPVFLNDSVEEKYCTICDEHISVSYHNPKDLIAIVAVLRATHPCKLSGQEVRFLRKSLGKKAKEFAQEIATSPEQLSRYENDKQPISEVYERLLRALVCLGHFDQTYRLGIDASKVLSMSIKGVRSCDQVFQVDLSLEDDSNNTPKPVHPSPTDEQQWRKQA